MSWRLTLDQDLIETLKSSFPSWFPGDAAGTPHTSVASPSSPTGSSSCSGLSVSEKSPQQSPSSDSLGLLLATSPRSNGSASNSSSGVSSNDSTTSGGARALSFRSSLISSKSSFPPSPPQLVIYATQIDHPSEKRKAGYQKSHTDMAEGKAYYLRGWTGKVVRKMARIDRSLFVVGHHDRNSPFRQPPNSSNSEPPQLHSFSIDAAGNCVRQTSPPKAIVDSSPLQLAMDKNKECKLHLFTAASIFQIMDT